MSATVFDDLKAGLQEALEYARGDRRGFKTPRIRSVDVQRVRRGLGLSQQGFADLFGVSLRTLQNWEQGHRQPEGPARVLLRVIERKPAAVFDALRGVRKRA